MPDTGSNIIITTNDTTAVIATDYGTSGIGFTGAHVQLFKLAYGSDSTTQRVGTSAPLPISIYGVTGTTLPISGSVSGSGNFNIVNSTATGSYIFIGGSTWATVPVGVSGTIQGVSGGQPVGITGTVSIASSGIVIYGISGATAVGITGGRRLSYSTDSVTVYGNIGISGGIGLAAATSSVAVYGSDLGGKVLTRLYSSDGTTLGVSGDALKVAITNAGITFGVTIAASVGITNDGIVGLMIRGTGNTASHPVIVKGQLASGAIEVTATSNLPVAVQNTVTIDDADLINSLESTSKPIVSNLSSIKTNTNVISTINDKLSNGTVQSKITEIVRPGNVTSGKKSVTETPVALTTASISVKVGVHVKCPTTNTSTVYIGGRNILTSQADGYPLDAGESIFIECDLVSKIFARSEKGTQTVHFITS